jgi:hypothetical protein
MTTNDTQDPAKEESTSQSGRVLYTKGPTFTDAPTVALRQCGSRSRRAGRWMCSTQRRTRGSTTSLRG